MSLASTSLRSLTVLTKDDGFPDSKFENDPENYTVDQSNRPSAKLEADLKLRARLLPELYDTKSNYKLIITITKFEKNMTVV